MLGEHLAQLFHPGGGEGDGVLVVHIVDRYAAVLGLERSLKACFPNELCGKSIVPGI